MSQSLTQKEWFLLFDFRNVHCGTKNLKIGLNTSEKFKRALSQAAACDGNLYQMMPEGSNTMPATGVLPI